MDPPRSTSYAKEVGVGAAWDKGSGCGEWRSRRRRRGNGGKIKGERWCRRSGWTGAWRGRKKGKKSKRRRTNKRKKFQNSYVSIGRVGGGVLISIKSLSSARIPFETRGRARERERERGDSL